MVLKGWIHVRSIYATFKDFPFENQRNKGEQKAVVKTLSSELQFPK